MRQTLQSGQNVAKASDVKMAKTFALIIGTNIIFWAPLAANFLVVAFAEDRGFFQENWSRNMFQAFSVCAAHFNSAANPFIYAYRMKGVGDMVKEIFMRNQPVVEEKTSSAQQDTNTPKFSYKTSANSD